MDLPVAASDVMERVSRLYGEVLIVAAVILAFAIVILAVVVLRFRRSVHPVPAVTQHALLEALWGVVPALLVGIVSLLIGPSIYAQSAPQKADATIHVVAHQDYWTYSFTHDGGFKFDSVMLEGAAAKDHDDPRLLGVDNPLYVPIGKVVELEITSADVLHGWSVPALGLRVDAVPGRINRVWFTATKLGTYYGMGTGGSSRPFAPIVVKVVDQMEYLEWVAHAKLLYSAADMQQFAWK
jgi:cytochrome c oxidase subunit 2